MEEFDGSDDEVDGTVFVSCNAGPPKYRNRLFTESTGYIN